MCALPFEWSLRQGESSPPRKRSGAGRPEIMDLRTASEMPTRADRRLGSRLEGVRLGWVGAWALLPHPCQVNKQGWGRETLF